MATKASNALVNASRSWHTWLGVAVSAFVLIVCVTGVYLNHKELFVGQKKSEKEHGKEEKTEKPEKTEKAHGKEEKAEKPKRSPKATDPLLRTDATEAFPVDLRSALTASAGVLGDQAIDQVTLKLDHGTLVYRIKAVDGREAIVDVRTASTTLHGKGQFSAGKPSESNDPIKEKPKEGPVRGGDKSFNWGKFMKDLHTGKLGGEVGKLVVDATAGVLSLLTLTGLYLWAVPRWRKRRSRLQREAAARATASGEPSA